MVATEPYKGATIAADTINRIRENYEIVAMMEEYSAKLAAGRMRKKEYQKPGRTTYQRSDVKEWQRINKKFHRIINPKNGNGLS